MSAKKRKCQCGCGVEAFPNRMTLVRCQYRQEEIEDGQKRPDRVRDGRAFLVRPECEAPFKIELNLMSTLRELAILLGQVPWWRRLTSAHSIYAAKFKHDLRNKGVKMARRDAWRTVLVTVLPDWAAGRLTTRWKRVPAAPAIPAPALPVAP